MSTTAPILLMIAMVTNWLLSRETRCGKSPDKHLTILSMLAAAAIGLPFGWFGFIIATEVRSYVPTLVFSAPASLISLAAFSDTPGYAYGMIYGTAAWFAFAAWMATTRPRRQTAVVLLLIHLVSAAVALLLVTMGRV